jgi:hypothetical protein
MMHYELELVMVNLRGRQNGGRRVRLDELHQQLPYDKVSEQHKIVNISFNN